MRRLFLVALLALACHHDSGLPRLFPVPDATLTSDAGQPVRLGTMKGSVTVYDFIFTNCAGTCPLMSATMRQITQKVGKDTTVRFVSISVDPSRDTPAALKRYASHLRNDARWLFLTGDRDTILHLSVNGFKLAAGSDPTPAPGAEPILHSSKFAIADKDGMIREYYGATESDAAEHVAATVKSLLAE